MHELLKNAGLDPVRILVVDDHEENLQIVGETLRAHFSCDLAFALDGKQGLCSALLGDPDLILLDISMPEMTGLEVCAKLKQFETMADIPILFLTARTNADDIVAGFEAGGVDYLAKPFNPSELVARVGTHLRLRQTKKLLDTKNEDLKQLLHILCHDLATPVGAILSLLDLIDEETDVNAALSRIRERAAGAMEMIDVVRQMRALEEGKLSLNLLPVNLAAAVSSAVCSAREKYRLKPVQIDIQIPHHLSVMAEPTILSVSVLCNLLTNAIKFSFPGDTITVSTRNPGNGWVEITIQDTGIGMPARLLHSLFNPTATTSRPGTSGEIGTGFGMILVKKFVETFGGTIEVTSSTATAATDPHGTTVTLRLPAAATEPF